MYPSRIERSSIKQSAQAEPAFVWDLELEVEDWSFLSKESSAHSTESNSHSKESDSYSMESCAHSMESNLDSMESSAHSMEYSVHSMESSAPATACPVPANPSPPFFPAATRKAASNAILSAPKRNRRGADPAKA
jgi:hypothetical protein